MRKKQLEDLKKQLIQYKDDLLKNVKNNDTNIQEKNDEVRDSVDIATDYYERELAIGLSEGDRQKLKQVEDALERIEQGSYGKCESCGGLIAVPRLEALPFAKLCINCQAAQEKTPKVNEY